VNRSCCLENLSRPVEQDLLPQEPVTRLGELARPIRSCKPGQPRQQAHVLKAAHRSAALGPTDPSLARTCALRSGSAVGGGAATALVPFPASAREPPPAPPTTPKLGRRGRASLRRTELKQAQERGGRRPARSTPAASSKL
jgi:hypothetical protein